jgi:hypothetical protein
MLQNLPLPGSMYLALRLYMPKSESYCSPQYRYAFAVVPRM